MNIFDDEDLEEELDNPDESDPLIAQLMAEIDTALGLNKGNSENINPDECFLDDTWREAWSTPALILYLPVPAIL